MKKITLSLLLILMATVALAQTPDNPTRCNTPADESELQTWGEPGRGPGGGPGGHGGPWMSGGHDRDHREMRDAFRLYKLTEYLELDESQTAAIYPRIAAMNKARDENHKEARLKMDELKLLVEKGKQKQAAKLAREIHDLKLANMTAHHQQVEEIMGELNEDQLAKFVLFERKFAKHMQGVRHKVKERRIDAKGRSGAAGKRGR